MSKGLGKSMRQASESIKALDEAIAKGERKGYNVLWDLWANAEPRADGGAVMSVDASGARAIQDALGIDTSYIDGDTGRPFMVRTLTESATCDICHERVHEFVIVNGVCYCHKCDEARQRGIEDDTHGERQPEPVADSLKMTMACWPEEQPLNWHDWWRTP
jgi:hypothetical protein